MLCRACGYEYIFRYEGPECIEFRRGDEPFKKVVGPYIVNKDRTINTYICPKCGTLIADLESLI